MKPHITHLNKLPEKTFSKLTLRMIPPHLPLGNISLIHEHLPADTKLPAVLHEVTTEMVFCLKGHFTVTLGNKSHSLSEGHIVWIPPKTWHTFITKKDSAEALSIFYPSMNMEQNPDVVIQPE